MWARNFIVFQDWSHRPAWQISDLLARSGLAECGISEGSPRNLGGRYLPHAAIYVKKYFLRVVTWMFSGG